MYVAWTGCSDVSLMLPWLCIFQSVNLQTPRSHIEVKTCRSDPRWLTSLVLRKSSNGVPGVIMLSPLWRIHCVTHQFFLLLICDTTVPVERRSQRCWSWWSADAGGWLWYCVISRRQFQHVRVITALLKKGGSGLGVGGAALWSVFGRPL